jgi:S-adenosylmethionine synthetase
VDLLLDRTTDPPLERQPVEVVERKGLGHPDTLCDALAEAVAVALAHHYLDRFGVILHHNVDKVLLVGGSSRPAFGGGEVVEPMEIFIAGRAARTVGTAEVPVDALAVDACRRWLAAHLPDLDPARHVRIHCRIRPGAQELVELFMRQKRTGVWVANDTSIGVGYAPLTRLEHAVLALERQISGGHLEPRAPGTGTDVKVMAVRRGPTVDLTVATAFVGRRVPDLRDYLEQREALRAKVASEGARALGTEVAATVNAADDPRAGSVYLTVTGTSAEAGDDGEAGRGNRHNGLIAPYRPMTMESVAGKNPVSHVGKIYNILADRMASELHDRIEGVDAAEVRLVSRIGAPVSEPQLVHVRIHAEGDMPQLHRRVEEIARAHLAGAGSLWRRLLEPPG